jgi:hypothetical protein
MIIFGVTEIQIQLAEQSTTTWAGITGLVVLHEHRTRGIGRGYRLDRQRSPGSLFSCAWNKLASWFLAVDRLPGTSLPA